MEPAHGGRELSITLPYYINFTIQHLGHGQKEPCILRWSADLNGFSRARFILLRRNTNGSLDKVDVVEDHLAAPDYGEEATMSLDKYNSHEMHELKAGDSVNFRAKLPESYQKRLVPSEQYHLIWPGTEICMWDWGTIEEHI